MISVTFWWTMARRRYLDNVVKHFKWVAKGKRRMHKTPSAREIAACLPWLEKEIELINRKCWSCLGATAAKALLGRDFKVTQQRGQALPTSLDRYAVATVHPSSILRQPTSEDRHRELKNPVADLKLAASLLDSQA
jgi:DNA polymerase